MNKLIENRFAAGVFSGSRWLLLCLGLLLVGSSVQAQTRGVAEAAAPVTTRPVASDARALHRVSLTLSLFYLLGPALQLTSEVRLHPRLSVAAIGGIGRFGRDPGLEFGGQLRAYVLGDFDHGLNVGAEGLYHPGVSFSSGLFVSPFIGYKFVARVGFTVDAQVGARIHVARAFELDESRLSLLLNLRVGWSF